MLENRLLCWQKGKKVKARCKLNRSWGTDFFFSLKMWTFAVFCPTLPIPWFNWVLSCHKVFSMESIPVPRFFFVEQDLSLFTKMVPPSRACTQISVSSVEWIWLYRRQTIEQVLESTCLPDQQPNPWAKELFDFFWPWKYLIWGGQMELDQGDLDPLVTLVWKILMLCFGNVLFFPKIYLKTVLSKTVHWIQPTTRSGSPHWDT